MNEVYQNLVEEHNNHDVNLFKKVLITTKRAKSLYSLEESSLSSMKHKPPFQAILENNEGRLIIKNSPKDISSNQKE